MRRVLFSRKANRSNQAVEALGFENFGSEPQLFACFDEYLGIKSKQKFAAWKSIASADVSFKTRRRIILAERIARDPARPMSPLSNQSESPNIAFFSVQPASPREISAAAPNRSARANCCDLHSIRAPCDSDMGRGFAWFAGARLAPHARRHQATLSCCEGVKTVARRRSRPPAVGGNTTRVTTPLPAAAGKRPRRRACPPQRSASRTPPRAAGPPPAPSPLFRCSCVHAALCIREHPGSGVRADARAGKEKGKGRE